MSDNTEKKPQANDGAKQESEQIQLKVRDADGNEVFFRIKKHTQLKKLMDAYCNKKGAAPGSFRFLFDGERLNEDDTPEKLNMEDMDSIDAMLYQQGGAE